MREACSDTKRLKIHESMSATRQRRKHQACRVFKVKIDESKMSSRQREQLKMMFVEAKWIKNDRIAWAHDNRKSIFDCTRPRKHDIVNVKTKDGTFEQRELKHIGSQMAQGVVDEMKANVKTIISLQKSGLQHGGDLKFVSNVKSLTLIQYGSTYKFRSDKKMKIQGVSGLVRISGAQQFIDNPDIELASAKLINDPSGYYVAVSTFTFFDKLPIKKFNGKTVALDLGCETTVTYSDGRKQSVIVEEPERIKRLQRKLSRQEKGSNNWNRTRRLIGIEHDKMTNKKSDAANKVLSELKYYNNVVIQDEQLSKWQKSGHGKKIQHSCLGRLKAKLKTFDNVIILAANIPTTKICMDCGRIYDMKQSQRTFRCDCGVNADRDVHAAQNMIEIAKMILDSNLKVPVGRRELKREEFLTSYEKKFSVAYGTRIHEADKASVCR